MAQLTVELDEHPLLDIGHVVPFRSPRRERMLPHSTRQPVRSLDIAQIAHLHGAFGTACNVTEHESEKLPTRVT